MVVESGDIIVNESDKMPEVVFSKRWEIYDNAHLKDKSKDILIEAYRFGNAITMLRINVNGNITYVHRLFSVADIQERFKHVKTLKQLKQVLSDIILND